MSWRSILIAGLALGIGAQAQAQAQTRPKDVQAEINRDVQKNVSPHMWNEVKGMVDERPTQKVELTEEERREWSQLLGIHGNKTPAWLEKMLQAKPEAEAHP